MTVNDALHKAIVLLDKKGWCQRAMKNRKGECCIVGAINEVTRHSLKGADIFDATLRRVAKALPYHTSIVGFNDTKGRKKEEVIAVLKKAIDNGPDIREVI